VQLPLVREAIFLASPNLVEHLDAWRSMAAGQNARRIELTLARYASRMCARPTPFGLFAACTVGQIGDATDLRLATLQHATRSSRLDMDYLGLLSRWIRGERLYDFETRVYANSTIRYRNGRVVFIATGTQSRLRRYSLEAAETSAALKSVLDAAFSGAPLFALQDVLVRAGAEPAEATTFLHSLVEADLLIPDCEPRVTGDSATDAFLSAIARVPAAAGVVSALKTAEEALRQLDAKGVGDGNPIDRYEAIVESLRSLPIAVDPSRLFQVDVVRQGECLTLGAKTAGEMLRGAQLIQQLIPPFADPLADFVERFVQRYDREEVPLLVALDEDLGLGESVIPDSGAGGASPSTRGNGEKRNLAFERILASKVASALEQGLHEIAFSPSEIATAAGRDRPQLPGAFCVQAAIGMRTTDAGGHDDPDVHVMGMLGPSGATLLGRFAHADPALREGVENHLRAEEALQPDAIFAEVVHLPQARVGNVLCRPALRRYEIPVLTLGDSSRATSIALSDLRVAVVDGQIVLRSHAHGRQVIPRLTTAHSFLNAQNVNVYRFLCALQQHGTRFSQGWQWGELGLLPHLPRVRLDGIVVALERWRLGEALLQGLLSLDDREAFWAIQDERRKASWPRLIALVEADNQLLIDLDNPLSVATLCNEVKGEREAIVREVFPLPDVTGHSGGDRAYAHEVVVPYVLAAPLRTPANVHPREAPQHPREARSIPPGGEWLFVKLYTGSAESDNVLRSLIRPFVAAMRESGLISSWFFIRYADPDTHLRIRFRGAPSALAGEVLPQLRQWCIPWFADRRIWRIQCDTYEREIERYGGVEATGLAEALFAADSDAVLAILNDSQGAGGGVRRDLAAHLGVDRLLADAGLAINERRRLMLASDRLQAAYAKPERRHAYGTAYREFRKELEPGVLLLESAPDVASLPPTQRALVERSRCTRPILGEASALFRTRGNLTGWDDALLSYAHMHLNRIRRLRDIDTEAKVYDHLARCYQSLDARRAA